MSLWRVALFIAPQVVLVLALNACGSGAVRYDGPWFTEPYERFIGRKRGTIGNFSGMPCVYLNKHMSECRIAQQGHQQSRFTDRD